MKTRVKKLGGKEDKEEEGEEFRKKRRGNE